MSGQSYERNGLKVTQLSTLGSDFFPILRFKVELDGETRIDKVDSSEELDKFMYLDKQKNIVEAYYDLIV